MMNLSDHFISLSRKKPLHFSLLDPDKQSPKVAGAIAKTVTDAGSNAIMVGGSTIRSQEQVDRTVKAIKQHTDLPVILFPSGARFLTPHADAVFFMSLMNSRNLDYVIREHVHGSLFVKKTGLEPIPMGYVIVEPGMTVGRVGEADLIKNDDFTTAVGYALAAQFLGMRFFYLEAGSGASYPVSNEMIKAVRDQTDIVVLVGGGIRDAHTAGEKAQAGAHIVVTGTTLEQDAHMKKTLTDIIEAIKKK